MATSTDLRSAIEEVQNQIPEDQLDSEGFGEAYEVDWSTRIEQRVGALPWWVISAVVHSVIFLLATLLTVALPPAQEDEVIITTDVARKEEPKYDQKKKRDIFKNPQEVKAETQVENPVVVHEQTEITDHFETENEMDNQNARGSEDAISDIPLGGTGVTGSMGVGGGGMAGVFGYRGGGGRKRATARFGGSPATESAVDAALAWLARHQEADGHWEAKKWEAKSNQSDVGLTGLAVLAFLGAGFTEKSGKYRDNVRRGVSWLISKQSKDGAIGRGYNEPWHSGFTGYLHPMAGLALAEAYGMAKNPRVGAAAQKAVDFSINVQQAPYSGWRYKAKTKKADTSVTGWYVMQVKSARIAGLKVDASTFQGAINFIDKCTDKKGRVSYMEGGTGSVVMTPVGMVARQFAGIPNTDPALRRSADYLMKTYRGKQIRMPVWDKKNYTFYFWYYGTLAMFQMGGKEWTTWNKALKKTLLPNQRKGGPMDGSANDVDGSWDMVGNLDKIGGRVYTTAVGALCLEVYYRYLPMYSK